LAATWKSEAGRTCPVHPSGPARPAQQRPSLRAALLGATPTAAFGEGTAEGVNGPQTAWSQAAEASEHPKAPSVALDAHEVTGNFQLHPSPLSLVPTDFNSSLAAFSCPRSRSPADSLLEVDITIPPCSTRRGPFPRVIQSSGSSSPAGRLNSQVREGQEGSDGGSCFVLS